MGSLILGLLGMIGQTAETKFVKESYFFDPLLVFTRRRSSEVSLKTGYH